MALTGWSKFRNRGQFGMSVGVRDTAVGTNPNKIYWIIEGTSVAGGGSPTLALSSNGTSPGGTGVGVDFGSARLAIPNYATALGTASVPFGTASAGKNGQISTGFTAASAQIGFIIGGTAFVMSWATAGGTPVIVSNPAGA